MSIQGIVEIERDSKNFPKILKEIHDCPKSIYFRGNIDLLKTNCLGVVGTRLLSNYGKEATEKIVTGLSKYFTIVSGLALGIDALAHKTTLENGGKTIAVLGSGIDDASIYPRTNFNLAKKILDSDGLIISEYPPGTHATEFTFPARNRIISGLSKGVVVMEADLKSGSLITARFALEQGRDVFAVPGNISSPKSRGANLLIQKGAKLVTSDLDILEEYDYILPQDKREVKADDPLEGKILEILGNQELSSIDDIIRYTGHETSEVLAKLSIMEIKGKIKNTGTGKYKLL